MKEVQYLFSTLVLSTPANIKLHYSCVITYFLHLGLGLGEKTITKLRLFLNLGQTSGISKQHKKTVF